LIVKHPMRRQDRALSEAEAREILARAEYGVLASVGEDGWPYAVPVNHVLSGDSLYIHCAVEGHKLQNLAHNERVSYCVVGCAEVLQGQLSTRYESAIAFGRVSLLQDPAEKRTALEELVRRLAPVRTHDAGPIIENQLEHTVILRLRLERLTGKARR